MKKVATTKFVLISAVCISASLIAGCASDGSLNKAGIGAITGAIGGVIIGNNTGSRDNSSRALGAVLGGLAGAGVGGYMDKQQRDLEEKLARETAAKQIAIERLQNNIVRLNLDSAATFTSGKANLNTAFHQSLNKIANSLSNNNQTMVHVIGYTDSVGAEDYNLRLSEDRAQNVAQFLIAQGVANNRVKTQGLGESRPVADNSSEAGRRQNRRVEIYLKPIVQGQEAEASISPVQ